MSLIKAVKGMYDIFANEIYLWNFIENKINKISSLFGYNEIRTPIVENLHLFKQSVGENTDIVNKEMYTLNNNQSLVLRPEGTAGTVRALLQANSFKKYSEQKYYYIGPMFRKEKPQKGRLRQFHQFGIESFGYNNYILDIEVIYTLIYIFQSFGLNKLKLHINSLGNLEEQKNFSKKLYYYYLKKNNKLCIICKKRLKKNSLRILDCKNQYCYNLKNKAPIIIDSFKKKSKKHLNNILLFLNKLSISYTFNQNLVRGIDYYTNTVFELYSTIGLGTQNAIAAGGRYNNLVNKLGNINMPAVGFAAGIERIILLLKLKKQMIFFKSIKLFLITADKQGFKKSIKLFFEIRKHGISINMDFSKKSVKSQMRKANKSHANFIIIIGKKEISTNICYIKNLELKATKKCKLSSSHIIKHLDFQ